MPSLRVLILGGAGEASELARLLAGDDRFAAVVSLAGRTRAPHLPPIPYRIGGFGGIDGLVRWLSDQRTEALVCATHPFAAQMRQHAVVAAKRTGIPLLMVERPAWEPATGDRWIGAADMAAAAETLGRRPQRVLLTIGQKDLAPFVAAPWHAYVVRSIEPPAPDSRPMNTELISGRGPFSEADERALLIDRRIDVMVTKNSGGDATAAKLAAARALGMTVIMVRRPPAPVLSGLADVGVAYDARGARTWLEARHVSASRLRGV